MKAKLKISVLASIILLSASGCTQNTQNIQSETISKYINSKDKTVENVQQLYPEINTTKQAQENQCNEILVNKGEFAKSIFDKLGKDKYMVVDENNSFKSPLNTTLCNQEQALALIEISGFKVKTTTINKFTRIDILQNSIEKSKNKKEPTMQEVAELALQAYKTAMDANKTATDLNKKIISEF